MKDYYVALTGGKNNAGDFLIKKRAFDLFAWLRPDRDVIDFNAWEKLDKEKLQVINSSKALLFLGGPALRKDMFQNIYNIPSLNNIEVPIISLGIGWKSLSGKWKDTRNYPLDENTFKLIDQAGNQGYKWSVRDYTSHNSILSRGSSAITMTGCPALYSKDHLNQLDHFKPFDDIKKVSFSLGVNFRLDRQIDQQQKSLIKAIRGFFKDSDFEVVFHHGISQNYKGSVHADKKLLQEHINLAHWLGQEGIKYVDISGSAENLMKHYTEADFHIGYRVHAHIFMSSISKPSILITEDGRGAGLSEVIPGLYFNSFDSVKTSNHLVGKAINKLNEFSGSRFEVYEDLPNEVITNLKYEIDNNFPRMKRTRASINNLFPVMERFIKDLP